jgi:hypothetical protein
MADDARLASVTSPVDSPVLDLMSRYDELL